MKLTEFKNKLKRFLVVSTVAVMLCGCTQATEEEGIVVIDHEEAEIAYEFAVVQRADVQKHEKLSCTYRQTNEQEVSFKITGKLVDKVHVKEGDRVTKGTLLAELTSDDLQRKIEDCEYQITRNQLQLGYLENNEAYDISGMWVNYLYYSGQSERDKSNLDDNIANTQKNYRYKREDFEDAIAADTQKLEILKRDLRNSRVYAELDGVVYKVKERLKGSTSKENEVIMTIVDTSECLFETSNPEMVQYFAEGQTVKMNISYGAGAGDYELMPYHMDEWEDKQLFYIFDGPENSELEVNSTGIMSVVVAESKDVLSVPLDAVHTADGKYYVYILSADNMREVKWVEVGIIGDDSAEITGGLEEGEKVIRK